MNAMTTIQEVHIPAGAATVVGDLRIPPGACGVVIFVHGGGSGRFSVRNRRVAEDLDDRGFATLMLDLLTPDEEWIDAYTTEYRFDIPRLAQRIEAVVDWVRLQPPTTALPVGCFGASTGAAAALMAAAHRPTTLLAIVSRGGRPDLAGTIALEDVEAATLLIAGGQDQRAIEIGRWTMRQLHAPAELEIVPGATDLFEEAGALDRVGRATARWFGRYLAGVALVAAAG